MSAPGTAGFCPGPPNRRARGRSLHWGIKTQWFIKRNEGQRPSSSGLRGVFREPSLRLGGLGGWCLSHRLQDGRSWDWRGGRGGEWRGVLRRLPLQASPRRSCPTLTPLFLGDPKLFWGAVRLLELFFGAPERKAEASPLPLEAFYSPERERWGSEKGTGGRQRLGDQFTFSTFRPQTKYTCIITKRERKLV